MSFSYPDATTLPFQQNVWVAQGLEITTSGTAIIPNGWVYHPYQAAMETGGTALYFRQIEDSMSAPESVEIPDVEGFIHVIRHALSLGDHERARQIADQAIELNPENVELTKVVHILAGPVVTRVVSQGKSFGRDNQLWLARNYETYKGKWVALQNGELVAEADTAKGLKEKVGVFAGMMVTKV